MNHVLSLVNGMILPNVVPNLVEKMIPTLLKELMVNQNVDRVRDMLLASTERARQSCLNSLWHLALHHPTLDMWNVLAAFPVKNGLSEVNEANMTVLMRLCHSPSRLRLIRGVPLLLRAGADLNVEVNGKTALSYLVRERTSGYDLAWFRDLGAVAPHVLFDAFHGQRIEAYESMQQNMVEHEAWVLEHYDPTHAPYALPPMHVPYPNHRVLPYLLTWPDLHPDETNEHGMTLLHWAISEGSIEKVTLLLRRFPHLIFDWLEPGCDGETACQAAHRSPEIIDGILPFLVDYQSNVEAMVQDMPTVAHAHLHSFLSLL